MISFWGSIFAIVFVSLFVWLFSGAYNFAVKNVNEQVLNDKTSRFMFIALMFFGLWLCYWLLCQERFIYYWDYSGYWMTSVNNMKFLFSKPIVAIMTFGGSILFSEYNNILPMLISIPLKISGYTFTRYVLVNCICFLVPAWFILLSVMKSQNRNRTPMFLYMFAALTFAPFYCAMLRGYIDVGCLVPASLSMLLLKDYDAVSLSREQIKRDVYISSVLLCTFMFRRYFAFYVEGYVFGLMLLSLYSVYTYSGKESRFKLFMNALANIAVIGVFALAIMLIFFAPVLIRILRSSYSQMYEGYNAPLMEKILRVIKAFGPLTFILAISGLIMSLITKTMRRYSCFCFASLIFTTAAFFHVQSMGIHHVYTISIQLYILVCICLFQIIMLFRAKAARNLILCLCLVLMSTGFANTFFPEVRPSVKTFSGLFGDVYNPLRRNDIHELNEIADYVNSITSPDKKVAVLASSGILNSSLMSNLRLPYEGKALYNMLILYDVDLRDGFSIDFLSADIIVTADPVQLHLNEGTQEIIRFPAIEIMSSDSRLGRHFVRHERNFTLDDNVKVYVYEKQSEFEPEDLQYMADYYTRIYTGYENMFADRILGRQSFRDIQESKGRSGLASALKFLIHSGLFTPEELAEITDRPVWKINAMIED